MMINRGTRSGSATSLCPRRRGPRRNGIAECEHGQAAGDHDRGQPHEHPLRRRVRIRRGDLKGIAPRTETLECHAGERPAYKISLTARS